MVFNDNEQFLHLHMPMVIQKGCNLIGDTLYKVHAGILQVTTPSPRCVRGWLQETNTVEAGANYVY